MTPRRQNLRGGATLAAALSVALVPVRYSSAATAWLAPLFLALLAAVSLVCTLLLRRKISLDAQAQSLRCHRGSDAPLQAHVRSGSVLSCPRATAKLFVSDLSGGTDTVTPVEFPLSGGDGTAFAFDIAMNHVGLFRAGLKDLEVFDFLGLFRFPVPGRRELTVTVLPREVDIHALDLTSRILTERQNARKNAVSDGFDYTGVREYAIGDSMKRIHWKLSSHTAGYMTKITETGLQNDLSVVLDVTVPPDITGETRACLNDALMEYALAYYQNAVEQDTECVLLYPGRDGEVHGMASGKGEELVREMALPGAPDAPDGLRMLDAAGKAGFSSLLLLTACPDPALLRRLETLRQTRRNIALLRVLPFGLDQRQKQEYLKPLAGLEAFGIHWSTVTAEPERDGL